MKRIVIRLPFPLVKALTEESRLVDLSLGELIRHRLIAHTYAPIDGYPPGVAEKTASPSPSPSPSRIRVKPPREPSQAA